MIRLIALLGTFFLFMSLSWVLWYAWDNKGHYSDEEIPVIIANINDYKVKPMDRGGKEIPHQDIMVYDVMKGRAPETGIANPLPDSETPLANAKKLVEQKQQLAKQQFKKQEEEIIQTAKKKPESMDGLIADILKNTNQVARPPVQKPQSVKNKTQKKSGAYKVQVFSARNELAAQHAWNKLQKKYPDLFSKQNFEIRKINLKNKGLYYRLLAGQFMTKAQANSFCSAFKAQGGSCFVIK